MKTLLTIFIALSLSSCSIQKQTTIKAIKDNHIVTESLDTIAIRERLKQFVEPGKTYNLHTLKGKVVDLSKPKKQKKYHGKQI